MVIISFVAFALLLIALASQYLHKHHQQTLPYHARGTLLTKAEQNFYEQIKPLVEDFGLRLNFKTRLWDIVDVDKGVEKQFSYQNKISSKHIDFVLVDGKSNIIGCIELDDASHNQKERIEADRFKNQVLQSASVPIIRVKATKNYNKSEIMNQLERLLK